MADKIGIPPGTYEKLTKPEHLRSMIPEELETIKEAIGRRMESLAEGVPENEKEADNPRLQREYTFDFRWKDGRGKVWTGSFTNRVLSIRDRQLMGIMRSNLGAGISPTNLDGLTAEINLMVAHLSFSLVSRPKWAEDLLALDDVRLLQEIYTEVVSHESTFLGYAKSSLSSGAGS
jgi:hypothetical protein